MERVYLFIIIEQEEFIDDLVQVEVCDKVFNVRVSEFGPPPKYDQIKKTPHPMVNLKISKLSSEVASSEECESVSPMATQKDNIIDSTETLNSIYIGNSDGVNDIIGETNSLNSLGEFELNAMAGDANGN
ncbi:hypothetical protein V6N13_024684 [Hibiscus sabdariffa]